MQNFPSCVDVFKVTLQSEFDFLLGSTLASRRQRESAFFSAIESFRRDPLCDHESRPSFEPLNFGFCIYKTNQRSFIRIGSDHLINLGFRRIEGSERGNWLPSRR